MHTVANNIIIEQVRLILANDRPTGSSAVLEITAIADDAPVTVTVELDARHSRVLLVLQDAYVQDIDRPALLRGLRHPEQIANLLDLSDPLAYVPQEQAIRSYCSQITRRLREAFARLGLQPAKLFTSQRGAGFRLLHPITVEYLERTRSR